MVIVFLVLNMYIYILIFSQCSHFYMKYLLFWKILNAGQKGTFTLLVFRIQIQAAVNIRLKAEEMERIESIF